MAVPQASRIVYRFKSVERGKSIRIRATFFDNTCPSVPEHVSDHMKSSLPSVQGAWERCVALVILGKQSLPDGDA
jgi:hypothetical protein